MINLIPMIAEKLGVEVGEPFKVKGYDGTYFKFDNMYGLLSACRLKDIWRGEGNLFVFLELCLGNKEIIKLRYKPKFGETYYYVTPDGDVIDAINGNSTFDFTLYKIGNQFRTSDEAHDNVPGIVKYYKEDNDD